MKKELPVFKYPPEVRYLAIANTEENRKILKELGISNTASIQTTFLCLDLHNYKRNSCRKAYNTDSAKDKLLTLYTHIFDVTDQFEEWFYPKEHTTLIYRELSNET